MINCPQCNTPVDGTLCVNCGFTDEPNYAKRSTQLPTLPRKPPPGSPEDQRAQAAIAEMHRTITNLANPNHHRQLAAKMRQTDQSKDGPREPGEDDEE